jgi:hypothetical protein
MTVFDELGQAAPHVQRLIRELRIRQLLAAGDFTFTWHL